MNRTLHFLPVVSIYGADPTASVESPSYAVYQRSLQDGSTGTILMYVTFIVTATVQNYLLRRLGKLVAWLLGDPIRYIYLRKGSDSKHRF